MYKVFKYDVLLRIILFIEGKKPAKVLPEPVGEFKITSCPRLEFLSTSI